MKVLKATPKAERLCRKRSCEFPGSGFRMTCWAGTTDDSDVQQSVNGLEFEKGNETRGWNIHLELSMALKPVRIVAVSAIVRAYTWLHIT